MLQETEIKLKIENDEKAKRLINKCETLSNYKFEKQIQRDEYYDSINGELKQNDLVVRLRTVNGKFFVALKSPRVFITDEIQKRIELEFEITDINKMREKIAEQGLKASAIIDKHRLSFNLFNCNILIDELPFIGWFLEIEGNDSNSINEAIERLNISNKIVMKNHYGEILDEKLKEIGLPLRPNLRATFEEYEIFKTKKIN